MGNCGNQLTTKAITERVFVQQANSAIKIKQEVTN